MNRRGEPGCCLTVVAGLVLMAGLTALGFSENAAFGAGMLAAIVLLPISVACFRARANRADPHATASPSLAPPLTRGWQRDPTGRYPFRYWDGQQWTDAVSTGAANGTDPL